jgi:hypothetical protein
MSNEENLPAFEQTELKPNSGTIYTDSNAFEVAKKVTAMLKMSDLVPDSYRNNPANIMIALDQAMRLNISPIFLMQRMSVVKGKPVMEGQLVIALINQRGPFKDSLHFKYEGEGEGRSCTCLAVRRDNGQECSSSVSVAVAKAAGWWERNPLWRALTDQMLAYRAAMFFARIYCPEVTFGMQLKDEVLDAAGQAAEEHRSKVSALNERLKNERGLS